jgi:hypothetical protein
MHSFSFTLLGISKLNCSKEIQTCQEISGAMKFCTASVSDLEGRNDGWHGNVVYNTD